MILCHCKLPVNLPVNTYILPVKKEQTPFSRGLTHIHINNFNKIFADAQFWKISREFNFADVRFLKFSREFNFADFSKNREIREICDLPRDLEYKVKSPI